MSVKGKLPRLKEKIEAKAIVEAEAQAKEAKKVKNEKVVEKVKSKKK